LWKIGWTKIVQAANCLGSDAKGFTNVVRNHCITPTAVKAAPVVMLIDALYLIDRNETRGGYHGIIVVSAFFHANSGNLSIKSALWNVICTCCSRARPQ